MAWAEGLRKACEERPVRRYAMLRASLRGARLRRRCGGCRWLGTNAMSEIGQRAAEANRAQGCRLQSQIGHRLGHGGVPLAHRLTSEQPPSDRGRNACSPGIEEISLK